MNDLMSTFLSTRLLSHLNYIPVDLVIYRRTASAGDENSE